MRRKFLFAGDMEIDACNVVIKLCDHHKFQLSTREADYFTGSGPISVTLQHECLVLNFRQSRDYTDPSFKYFILL